MLQHGQKLQGKGLSKGMVPSVLSHIVGLFGRWSCLCLQMLLQPLPRAGRWSTGWLQEHSPRPPPLPHELQTSAWPLDVPDSNTSLTDDGSREGFSFLSEAELAQGSSWQLSAFVSTRQSGAERLCCCGEAGHAGCPHSVPGLGHFCFAALSLSRRCSPAQRSFPARRPDQEGQKNSSLPMPSPTAKLCLCQKGHTGPDKRPKP